MLCADARADLHTLFYVPIEPFFCFTKSHFGFEFGVHICGKGFAGKDATGKISARDAGKASRSAESSKAYTSEPAF
jgi:hypothetical protein